MIMVIESLSPRVVIAIDNLEIRKQILQAISKLNLTLRVFDNSRELEYLKEDADIFLVETNDDVAALTQRVYELYKVTQAKSEILIIGMLSQDQMDRNMMVQVWLIDGHAALMSLQRSDSPTLPSDVYRIIHFLLKSDGRYKIFADETQ